MAPQITFTTTVILFYVGIDTKNGRKTDVLFGDEL